MPTTSIFAHAFLDFLNEENRKWATMSEEESSYFLESGGPDSGQVFFDTDYNSAGIFGSGNHENVNNPHHERNATSVASTSLNSTLITISTTLGDYITTAFSTESLGNNDNNNNPLSPSKSSDNLNLDFGVQPPDGWLNSSPSAVNEVIEPPPLLKLASSVIPENFQKLSSNSRNCVIAYVILFCIGAPGNLFVFLSVGREIWRRQLMRSRIKVLIWHLATADLFVTFVVIPVEIFWRLTIAWYGGDVLCKLAQFFRAFGLYLSSMVIICISLDRFFAIVFPLKVIGGMKRVRNMLCVAWTSSILFAAPQILVFSVQRHPIYPSFLLCSNSDYFLSLSKEIMYNLLSLIVMYFAPLIVIIVTYAMVLYTIARKSREHHQDSRPRSGSNQLRRSDNASNITRARRKTLWLSMVIVTVFVICWTPYVTMTLWYMFDFETAEKLVDPRIQEAFFVTAVSNSCVNPIIYGNYMKKYWRNLRNAACRSRTSSTSSSRILSNSRMHHHRAASSYRCPNPNHHINVGSRCHSSTNASDVTIVLKELSS